MNKLILILLCMVVTTNVYARQPKKRVKATVTVAAFTTESYLIADNQGIVLQERDSDLQRPIASISKLMVGLLASEQDLDEQLLIPKRRTVQSGIPYKHASMSRKELLTLALVKSDNFAAQILCENLDNCVDLMNEKATELGMAHTRFAEPTGLSKDNVSTASDLLKLMLNVASNQTITTLSSLASAEIPVGKTTLKIRNTNPLTSTMDVFLSKTGWTNPAGGCISMIIGNDINRRVVILLGSLNTRTRISKSLKLYKESL